MGEAVGGRVAVGGTGVNVGVGVAEGTADAMLGGAEVAQAEIKITSKIQTQNRFIQTFLRNRLYSLAEVDVFHLCRLTKPSQGYMLLVYYRLNGHKTTQLEFDTAGGDAHSERNARTTGSPLG